MTKKNQSVNGFVALLLLLAVVLACSTGGGNETEKANKLVDEGNTAIEEARKHVAEAEGLKKKMLGMKVSKLEEAHSVANDTIALTTRPRPGARKRPRNTTRPAGLS